MLSALRVVAMTFLVLLSGGPASAELRLLMIEQPGCAYCAKWDAQIAPIYEKTPEGQSAPLLRAQLRGPYPEGVDLAVRPIFTPTFVLLDDTREVGRIEGYPGEDFFWGLLSQMLQETGARLGG